MTPASSAPRPYCTPVLSNVAAGEPGGRIGADLLDEVVGQRAAHAGRVVTGSYHVSSGTMAGQPRVASMRSANVATQALHTPNEMVAADGLALRRR